MNDLTLAAASAPFPDLVVQIEALLPQTQCQACAHPDCAAYARSVVVGRAAVDACEPGGPLLARRLADLLEQPLYPTLHEMLLACPPPMVARIRDDDCIGCTKCLAVCPTDAILGAQRQLHGVLAADCTGCGLCLPPCPVDCIELEVQASALGPDAASPAVEAIKSGTALEACTSCGKCAEVCPSALAPRELALRVRALDLDAAHSLGLDRCTQCQVCDEVCPVRIPLSAYFSHAVALGIATKSEARRRAHALERQGARNRRLAQAASEVAICLVTPPNDRIEAEAGVLAALERRRARTVTSEPKQDVGRG